MHIEFDARAALRALEGFSADLATEIIDEIAVEAAQGVYKGAFERLSGDRQASAWDYPVPVRMGHLRRALYMLMPGGKKLGGQEGEREFKTRYAVGHGESYVGDSAAYAGVIHEGRIRRGALGGGRGMARPFLTDAGREFLGGGIQRIAGMKLTEARVRYGFN
ncbi:MAG: hypothetical protein HZA22_04720 [Nitrospirae bacterium]|nr:hypothetical protein [Nitrospirota bacterium]